jgi:excisionase family DNA binding protein
MTHAATALNVPLIPRLRNDLYDHRNDGGSRERMAYDKTDLERRLAGGEWLRVGAVAALLGQGRTTIHDRIKAGRIRYKETIGGWRLLHPEDVQRLLDETRLIHQDSPPAEPHQPDA